LPQQGIHRLSHAIGLSEEKVDHALKRTEEVYKQTSLRREKEIQDLRQVIVAKEHGIDSLRETLSCTKRSMEARIRELEETLRHRDAQVHPTSFDCMFKRKT
jgi:predicted  nucleic acid-binding Zn-ribbon protein